MKAEILYKNGTIFTVDSRFSTVEALASRKGKILAVGSEKELAHLVDQNTEIRDLRGKTALPGFIDPHSHFMMAGLHESFKVDLRSPPAGAITCMDDLIRTLEKKAMETPEGEWVSGYGYDDTLLQENRHPTRADLDRIKTNHPVFLSHVSGHLAAVNSVALDMAGIHKNTMSPAGGHIQKDEQTKEPNGILEEPSAMELVQQLMPLPDRAAYESAVQTASKTYTSRGVTCAQDGWSNYEITEHALATHKKGLLKLRLQVFPEAHGDLSKFPKTASGTALVKNDMVTLGACKLFHDGSIQGYTGYLTIPYHKQLYPQKDGVLHRGYATLSYPDLEAKVLQRHKEGWQIAIHGNGDAAINEILDAVEAAQKAFPRADARHIVIHCQTVREDQLDRMKRLGMIPAFFTAHIYYWGDRHRDIFLGPDRARRIDPCKSALARGMVFTSHNDTFVTPIDPLLCIWAAANRLTSSEKVLGEEFCVSVEEAIRSTTSYAAVQACMEDRIGTLEPGKYTDMVILEENPLKIDKKKIKDIKIAATVLGDELVFGEI